MKYQNYHQLAGDLEYGDRMFDDEARRSMRYEMYDMPHVQYRLAKLWEERIREKLAVTAKSDTALGKFLSKYPLSLKEFRVLLALIEDIDDPIFIQQTEGDPFREFRVRYESSMLRKLKLVFRTTNPLIPIRPVYKVSYRAQLALKNQRYTDAYEQLDMALEEESKKNSPDELDSLYYLVNPSQSFQDFVGSDEVLEGLKTAMARETGRDKIFRSWGLGKTIQYGQGTTLNFRGPPGTGKTLAAHCLAHELNKPLLIVRYDQLQSCYVGETEKHVQMVFKIASIKKAVLFFDEADAIALDRAQLDRSWEMSTVNTLLKELERFTGVCIFATNFQEKYDKAFERRLTMHIDFPLPTNEHCLKILEKLIPKRSRSPQLDLSGLDLSGMSGGDVKNLVLNAAGVAAKEGAEKIGREHILKALAMTRKGKEAQEKVNYVG